MWYVGTHKCTAKKHGNKPFFIGLLSVLLVQKRHFQYEFNMISIWTVVSWLFWYRMEYTIKYKIVLKIIVKMKNHGVTQHELALRIGMKVHSAVF